MTRWRGMPDKCTCTRFVVDTIEETLGCPGDWQYRPGVGWLHPRPAPRPCTERRCTRSSLAALAMAGAFLALGAVIAIPLALAIIPLALLFAAGSGLAALGLWAGRRCRHDSGGLEAIVSATREEHPDYRDWDIREITR